MIPVLAREQFPPRDDLRAPPGVGFDTPAGATGDLRGEEGRPARQERVHDGISQCGELLKQPEKHRSRRMDARRFPTAVPDDRTAPGREAGAVHPERRRARSGSTASSGDGVRQ